MNIERLQLMVTMLDEVIAGIWKVDGKRKSLSDFVSDVLDGETDFRLNNWVETSFDENTEPCGFSACAVGHACLDSRFNALSLEFKGVMPSFGARMGWLAVEEFFDLTDTQSSYLFYIGAYDSEKPTAAEVAERVREFIGSGGDVPNPERFGDNS